MLPRHRLRLKILLVLGVPVPALGSRSRGHATLLGSALLLLLRRAADGDEAWLTGFLSAAAVAPAPPAGYWFCSCSRRGGRRGPSHLAHDVVQRGYRSNSCRPWADGGRWPPDDAAGRPVVAAAWFDLVRVPSHLSTASARLGLALDGR
jgi:hypothetical protein